MIQVVDSSFRVLLLDSSIILPDAASFSIDTVLSGRRVILSKQSVTKMPDSPRSDLRAKAQPSVWAPFGWAAMLTAILAVAISFTNDLHSLPPHIGELFVGVLLLPAALAFFWLTQVPGNFLVWLSGLPEWLLFALMVLDAYFYSLILMMLIWIITRLAKAESSPQPALSSH